MLAPAAGDRPAWTLGADAIDARFGDKGLDPHGLHEIKPALPDRSGSAAGAAAAALGFVLRLALRRLQLVPRQPGAPAAPILICWPPVFAGEIGRLYGPGLASLGLDPSSLVIAEPAREKDALWTIEEGLRSGSLALVIGAVAAIGLTPARRLALAAEAGATPALLLTRAREPAAGATASRWRVAPAASGPHLLDAAAPGATRLALDLERCRHGRAGSGETSYVVEWSDASHRFRLAPRAGDRADGADRSRRHAV